MGEWTFDIPPFVKDEPITGGSEHIIDTYYSVMNDRPPEVGDSIIIEASIDKPEIYQAVCEEFTITSDFGHSYVERNSQLTGWFCPMMEVMFGFVPDKIYVNFITRFGTDREAIMHFTGQDIDNF